MSLFAVLVLGIVEGVTEFLPISSTAHLILTTALLNIPQSSQVKLFEVVIQGGAMFAIVGLFWRKVLTNPDLFVKACIAFVPTAIVGFFMRDFVMDVLFESHVIISGALMSVGLLFILIEWYIMKGMLKTNRDLSSITYKEALIVGLIQACAIIPGVSRAGAVLIGMMIMKFKRSEAALFSFLLAVPTIAAATMYELLKSDSQLLTSEFVGELVLGGFVAAISALVVVKWLIGYLQKNSLTYFGVYRIILGILVLLAGINMS
ncbi:undecaprenyl-diphosphate phosphatase [Candidatus Woesebacteria bacterium]|nr:undecaprenyl-diphosphate phosphatase [Candidatus Woesebacteria bacterium]